MLEINTRISNVEGQAKAMHRLGDIYDHQSKYIEAMSFYAGASDVYAGIADHESQVNALYCLSEICRHQSEYTKAESSYAQAYDVYTRIGDRGGKQMRCTVWERCATINSSTSWPHYLTSEQAVYAHIGDGVGESESVVRPRRGLPPSTKYSEAES